MNKKKAGVAFIALLTCALAGQALAQGPEFKSNADDLAKISGVVEEFRQDIIHKDGYAITKLILNPDVLFHHINKQDEVDSARKQDAQFDFVINGKVHHSGLEHWQVCKIDGQWKILSVTWTIYP